MWLGRVARGGRARTLVLTEDLLDEGAGRPFIMRCGGPEMGGTWRDVGCGEGGMSHEETFVKKLGVPIEAALWLPVSR